MSALKVFALLLCAFSVTQSRNLVDKTRPRHDEDSTYAYAEVLWQAIIPGTKWCGDGDIAKDYDDLGTFKKTDRCCRDHDLCDDVLLSGETRHNLTNDGTFTRLHCKCDHGFYDCLKEANDVVTFLVGTGYFNGLGGQCFAENHPATCVKWHSIVGLRKRCVKYEYDSTKPKIWQWFDVPRYV